jgi:preprotein translocase subunit SecB
MNNSPLQLKNYFVTSISLTANKAFDPAKEIKLQFEEVEVTPTVLKLKDEYQWQVGLRIQHQPTRPDANSPYFFTIEMVGFFGVDAEYPPEKHELLVSITATSVLYSAAREIVRSLTGIGPYMQLLLPTGSFYDAKAVEKTTTAAVAGKAKK